MMHAIAALNRLASGIARDAERLEERLAEVGRDEAADRFENALYAGSNDVFVSVQDDNPGKAVVADGNAAPFIEFGAGVRYYGGGYPGERPDGIVGIGGYGKGQGATGKPWFYKGDPGNLGRMSMRKGKVRPGTVMTYGNPPNAPMYHAANEMRERFDEIAREVFG